MQPSNAPSSSSTVVWGSGLLAISGESGPRVRPFGILFLRSMVCMLGATLLPYLSLSLFVVGSTAIPVAFTLGFPGDFSD